MFELNYTFSGFFPSQKKPDSAKNEAFYKENIDAGLALVYWANGMNTGRTVRNNRHNKVVNYNLWNDEVDPREVERVLNPFKLQGFEFPTLYSNYPCVNPNINVLIGEERRRAFNYVVTAVNEDAVTERVKVTNQRLNEFLLDYHLGNKQYSEQEVQQYLTGLEKWKTFTYKDTRERMASQTLNYLRRVAYNGMPIDECFSRQFEDVMISGEEWTIIDIYGGEPQIRKGNPMNLYALRGADAWQAEDSSIIIEDSFMPVGKVVDMYYDWLTPAQIDEMEKGYNVVSHTSAHLMGEIHNPVLSVDPIFGAYDVNKILEVNAAGSSYFGGYYDFEGNIRVTRVLWKSMRKIGIRSYYDENMELVEDIVPEQYKPDKEKGEKVEWKWISEWLEGTKIGRDMYVRMRPIPFQARHMDNLSVSNPGVVGTFYNTNSSKVRSMLDMTKEYQYLYNAIMHKLKLTVAKYKGKIAKLPLHLLPSGWDTDKIMYYAEYMGYMPIDAFNEGLQGAALGKLGGMMNESSPVIDLADDKLVQSLYVLLTWIQTQVDNITGVTPQRKGAVDNRETVGGVERAIMQSNMNTEKWFAIHDNHKVRVLKVLLEAAKVAWRGKNFKKYYVLDDLTKALLEFDSDLFAESEYAIDISTATRDQEVLQALRQMIQPFMQNGGTISMAAELLRNNDPANLQRKLEFFENEMQQNAQAAREVEAQQTQAELEAKIQAEERSYMLELEKLDRADMNAQLDRETDLQKASLQAMGFNQEKDINQNNVPDIIEYQKLAAEQSQKAFENAMEARKQKFAEKQHTDDVALRKQEIQVKKKQASKKPSK